MLALVADRRNLSVLIFSGLEPDAVRRALEGEEAGTLPSAHGRS